MVPGDTRDEWVVCPSSKTQSGIGCENSLHGLMEYTNWQTITLNKAPDAV